MRQRTARRESTLGVSQALVLLLASCGVNLTPQPEPLPVLPSCVPDRDGTITAAELPIALGLNVT
jgi:hypothetical protein